MALSIMISESAVVATVLFLVFFNIFYIATKSAILILWLTFCLGVQIVLAFLSFFSFVPGERLIWLRDDPPEFLWLTVAFIFSSSAMLEWRGAIAGYIALYEGVARVKEGVKHWGNLSKMAKAELFIKAIGLLAFSILQAVYFCTLDCETNEKTYRAANEHEHVRQLAVVGTLSSMVESAALVLNIALHCGGLATCDRLHAVLFPEQECLRNSMLDPTSRSFFLVPNITSLLVVVFSVGYYTAVRPCMLGQLILVAATFSLSKAKQLLDRYRHMMKNIPIQKATEEVTCIICQDPIKAGQLARALPCSHLFHTACLREWMADRPACPICRAPIPLGRRTVPTGSVQARQGVSASPSPTSGRGHSEPILEQQGNTEASHRNAETGWRQQTPLTRPNVWRRSRVNAVATERMEEPPMNDPGAAPLNLEMAPVRDITLPETITSALEDTDSVAPATEASFRSDSPSPCRHSPSEHDEGNVSLSCSAPSDLTPAEQERIGEPTSPPEEEGNEPPNHPDQAVKGSMGTAAGAATPSVEESFRSRTTLQDMVLAPRARGPNSPPPVFKYHRRGNQKRRRSRSPDSEENKDQSRPKRRRRN